MGLPRSMISRATSKFSQVVAQIGTQNQANGGRLAETRHLRRRDFVERYSFGWRLTAQGLEALELMDRAARAINRATDTEVSTKVDIERQEAVSPRSEETVVDAGREAGRLIA